MPKWNNFPGLRFSDWRNELQFESELNEPHSTWRHSLPSVIWSHIFHKKKAVSQSLPLVFSHRRCLCLQQRGKPSASNRSGADFRRKSIFLWMSISILSARCFCLMAAKSGNHFGPRVSCASEARSVVKEKVFPPARKNDIFMGMAMEIALKNIPAGVSE